jgi:hypothetical protein
MHVQTAQIPSPPAGADRVVVTSGAVVVLDGASAFGPATISPAAYADRLGTELASAIAASPSGPLPQILATAIAATASALHLRDDDGPSSTVAIARVNDGTADLLLLGDSASPTARPAPRPSSPTTASTTSTCRRHAATAPDWRPDQATTPPTRRPSANSRPASAPAGIPPEATGSPPLTRPRPRTPSPAPSPRRRSSGSSWPLTAPATQPGT